MDRLGTDHPGTCITSRSDIDRSTWHGPLLGRARTTSRSDVETSVEANDGNRSGLLSGSVFIQPCQSVELFARSDSSGWFGVEVGMA